MARMRNKFASQNTLNQSSGTNRRAETDCYPKIVDMSGMALTLPIIKTASFGDNCALQKLVQVQIAKQQTKRAMKCVRMWKFFFLQDVFFLQLWP